MYKTVRKGDASLQYTILPQTDQFYGNPPLPSPPPERNHLFVYKLSTVALIIVIFISCIAVALLINHSGPNIIKAVKINRIDHKLLTKIDNDSNLITETINYDDENDEIDLDVSSTISYDNFEDNFGTDGAEEAGSVSSYQDDISSTILPSTAEIKQTTFDSKTETTSQLSEINLSQSYDTTITPVLTSQGLFFSTKDYEKTSYDDDTTTMKSSTGSFKKAKMPRVTLKLRENETIPQMYMKAGIASYKKGNITTSVLAHGLSLEGLIFKTPEGTIKPWSEKWPFSDSSPYVQWKRDNEMREQIFAVLVTLMAVSVMIFCVLSLAQLKASRRRWQNIEEPPLKGREDEESEGRSKLLDSEDKENAEKE